MKFTVLKASDHNFRETIEVLTLEALEEYAHIMGDHQIIVDFEEREIWIYDDYME